MGRGGEGGGAHMRLGAVAHVVVYPGLCTPHSGAILGSACMAQIHPIFPLQD